MIRKNPVIEAYLAVDTHWIKKQKPNRLVFTCPLELRIVQSLHPAKEDWSRQYIYDKAVEHVLTTHGREPLLGLILWDRFLYPTGKKSLQTTTSLRARRARIGQIQEELSQKRWRIFKGLRHIVKLQRAAELYLIDPQDRNWNMVISCATRLGVVLFNYKACT